MPTDRIGSLDTARIAKIMKVALEEFATYNYHQASYNRIIRNCGMSKGTMYYYFRSKEDLFLTILNAAVKEFSNLGNTEATPTSAGQYWSQTYQIVFQLFQRLKEKPVLGRFVQGFLTAESRRSANPAHETIQRIDEWLQDYLLTGQLVEAIRRDIPMDLIIHLAWGLWETFCQWQKASDIDYPPHESASLLTDLWQRSLSYQNLALSKQAEQNKENESFL